MRFQLAPLIRSLFRGSPLLLAIMIGSIWTLFLLKNGGELSLDSLFYLKTAVYMHFNSIYNTTPTVWPPFFPMAIGALLNVVSWPATAGSLLSGLSLLGMLVLFCLIQQRASIKTAVVLSSLVCFVSLTAVWEIFKFVWSETLFNTLTLAHIFFLYEFLRTSKDRHAFLAAALLSLSAMTRYLGIAFFPIFAVVMFHRYIIVSSSKRVGRFVATVSISFFPTLCWLWRNYMVDGSLTGLRGTGRFTAMKNIDIMVETMRQDLHPLLLILFVIAALFFLYRLGWQLLDLRRTPGQRLDTSLLAETYLYSFCVIYSILLVYAASTTNINTISTRFLAALYPVFFIQLGFGIHQLYRSPQKKHAILVSACVSFLFLLVPAVNVDTVRHYFSTIHTPKLADQFYRNIGYDNSKSATQLSQYIEDAFTNRDTVYFSGFYNRRSHRHIATLGLFMRSGTIGKEAENVQITMTGPPATPHSLRFINDKNEFTVTYRQTGERRKIVFFNPDRAHRIQSTVHSISRLMTTHDLDELHFIVIRPFKTRPAFNFNREVKTIALPTDLKKTPAVQFANFAIHRFIRI